MLLLLSALFHAHSQQILALCWQTVIIIESLSK